MKRFLSLFIVAGLTLGLCLSNVTPAFAQAAPDPLKKTAIIGDSITAGYGVTTSERYTSLLQTTFQAQGRDVANFGISGATALRWLNCPNNPTQTGCKQPDGSTPYAGQYTLLQQYKPTTVLIALGTNELIISRSADTYATQMVQLAQRVYSLLQANPPLIAFVHHYDISAYGATLPAPGTTYDFINSQYGTKPRPTWTQYRAALSARAAPNGIGFVDISFMPLTRDVDFIADKGHIDASGHQIYYNTLNAVLQAAVPPPTAQP